MGKSRLLYEFRRRLSDGRAFLLQGSCSPDGRQTPFRTFIEVVRDLFQVSIVEPESEVRRKLEQGLAGLELNSPQAYGLLLNMIGLKPPDGALTGLDGVLIGLRTREMLQRLLAARCRRSQVALLIEDVHWIDRASEEVLNKIAGDDASLGLLDSPHTPAGIPASLERRPPRHSVAARSPVGRRHPAPRADEARS